MKLRIVSGFLVLIILIGLGVFLFHNERKPLSLAKATMIGEATTGIIYVLDSRKWTEFPLPKGARALKMVTTADIPSSLTISPQDNFRYAIEYELVDEDGHGFQNHEHHFMATLKQYKDPRFDKPITTSFYLDNENVPSDASVFMLNLEGMKRIAYLRVRLKSKDPRIINVGFRSSVKEELAQSKQGYIWLRMEQNEKSMRAKGNIYPPELLFENEVRNLLSEQDKPLGPAGIPGKDYHSKTIYILREPSGDEIPPPIIPYGVYMNKVVHGVVPLPEGNHVVRLVFESAGLGNEPAIGSKIKIRWIGRSAEERVDYSVTWTGKATRWEHQLQGGMLDMSSMGSLIAHPYLINNKKTENISPSPLYVRTYVTQKGLPVQYKINHVRDVKTLFRINLSFVMPSQGKGVHTPKPRYMILDKHGVTLKEGALLLNPLPSNYDRNAVDPFNFNISTSTPYFFSLPDNVATIKFISEEPVLLDAYNRPENLIRELKVPEDLYQDDPTKIFQPSWFSLKPIDAGKLLLSNRSVLVIKQHQIPEDNLEVLKGNYDWEDFHPNGDWLGRNILTPLPFYGVPKKEALPNFFEKIEANKTISLNFCGDKGARVIEPNLIYMRSKSKSSLLSIDVDGKFFYKNLMTGTSGEMHLPALSVGRHSVKLVTDANETFYINKVILSRGGLLKRLVNKLDKELTFDFIKRSIVDDIISIRYYVPYGTLSRTTLSVQIDKPEEEKINALRSNTFFNRTFDVRPNPSERATILNNNDQRVEKGELFFIPLGEDVPPGKYRVHVKLIKGNPGYISISHIMPGDFEGRGVFMEPELRNVHYIQ